MKSNLIQLTYNYKNNLHNKSCDHSKATDKHIARFLSLVIPFTILLNSTYNIFILTIWLYYWKRFFSN